MKLDRRKKLDQPLTQQQIDSEKDGLPPVDIVPPALIFAAARGYGYGIKKHGRPKGTSGFGTWRIPNTRQADPLTHYASLMRHLLKWRDGEVVDPDSGEDLIEHLEAAAAQLGTLIDIVKHPPTENT